MASKWVDEISENCPGVKMVLTALKCDLRKDEFLNDNPNVITYEPGLAKAKEIGAVKYLGKHCVAQTVQLTQIFINLAFFSYRMLRRTESRYHGNLLRSRQRRP